jgi:hypothetical protein
MKFDDLVDNILGEDYLEEVNWKGALAAGAMAASELAHGADADSVNFDTRPEPTKPAVQQPAISKATEAYNKFRKGEKLNDEEVAALATDKEYAKDYIIYLRTQQQPIPDILKKANPSTVQSTSKYIGG